MESLSLGLLLAGLGFVETPISAGKKKFAHSSQAVALRGEVQVFEERVDLSNDMTWRQMIGVGVRNVVLARGEIDKLEGPNYAARRAE